MIAFVCHPYHRGGVTSWMMDAFIELGKKDETCFITVNPLKRFFGGNRPLMHELIAEKYTGSALYVKNEGIAFELGTNEYRALVYATMIRKYVPVGATLIPSDDEACWMACAYLANKYKVIQVLHSDDDKYYTFIKKYHWFLSGFVSVSSRVKNKALAALNGVQPANMVIPCGVNIDVYKAAQSKVPQILWVGRLEERQKRVSDIVKIAMYLKQRNCPFVISVYGSGEAIQSLSDQTKQNEMDEQVKVMGWRSSEEIRDALSHAKVLLQTSNFEGMSVAVMEGLASGCMIVSTRVSGVEDLEQDEIASNIVKLYDIGDTEAASLLLKDCLGNDDPELPAKAIGLAARYYSIEACMKAYIAFSKLLKTGAEHYMIKSPVLQRIKSKLLGNIRYYKWKLGHKK